MQSPTARSLKLLRDEGYWCEIVEHWNAYSHQRHDLMGFGDILALGPGEIWLVQTTSGGNFSARKKKIIQDTSEAALAWLHAGGLIEVHGWRKLAHTGWSARREKITQEDFS